MVEFLEGEGIPDLPPQDKRPYCFCDWVVYNPNDPVCMLCMFNRFCSGDLVELSNGKIKKCTPFKQNLEVKK